MDALVSALTPYGPANANLNRTMISRFARPFETVPTGKRPCITSMPEPTTRYGICVKQSGSTIRCCDVRAL